MSLAELHFYEWCERFKKSLILWKQLLSDFGLLQTVLAAALTPEGTDRHNSWRQLQAEGQKQTKYGMTFSDVFFPRQWEATEVLWKNYLIWICFIVDGQDHGPKVSHKKLLPQKVKIKKKQFAEK